MKILQHIGPLGFADANELQIHRVVTDCPNILALVWSLALEQQGIQLRQW